MADVDESARMGGQTVVTVEDLSAALADSVSERVSGLIEDTSGRIADLESSVQDLSAQVRLVSNAAITREDLREEVATLQGEEIGPVVGELVEVILGDSQSAVLDGIASDISDTLLSVRAVESLVEDVSGVLVHPALTTNFRDYSVLEALLLLLVVWQVVKLCIVMVRGGFAWLR